MAFSRRKKAKTSREEKKLKLLEKFYPISRSLGPFLKKFWSLSREVFYPFSRSFGPILEKFLPFLKKFWTNSREVLDPFSRSIRPFLKKFRTLSQEVQDPSREFHLLEDLLYFYLLVHIIFFKISHSFFIKDNILHKKQINLILYFKKIHLLSKLFNFILNIIFL